MSNNYLQMVESYARDMEDMRTVLANLQKVNVRQSKTLLVNVLLLQQLHRAIVLGDDLELTVALLKDYFEPPPTGVN